MERRSVTIMGADYTDGASAYASRQERGRTGVALEVMKRRCLRQPGRPVAHRPRFGIGPDEDEPLLKRHNRFSNAAPLANPMRRSHRPFFGYFLWTSKESNPAVGPGPDGFKGGVFILNSSVF